MSFEWLPEGRDGVLVLWEVQLEICEKFGVLLGEVVESTQLMCVCIHQPSCQQWMQTVVIEDMFSRF